MASEPLEELRVMSLPNNDTSFRRRVQNIDWIRPLFDEEGLRHGVNERRVLIRQTLQGERVYLQYPGEETTEEGEKRNPLDFRPRLARPDGSWLENQSFADIWDAIQDTTGRVEEWQSRAFAAVLFRMAHMIDFVRGEGDIKLTTASVGGELFPRAGAEAVENFPPFWRYQPPEAALKNLGPTFAGIGGMSLEGFLYYNQILAWNEDCKYIGRDVKGAPLRWRRGSNTILTHLRVVGLLTRDIRLSKLIYPLSKIGVSPASLEEARSICRPWLDSMK